VLRKWNKSLCLSQLSLSDTTEPTDCYLYKLSEHRGWYSGLLRLRLILCGLLTPYITPSQVCSTSST